MRPRLVETTFNQGLGEAMLAIRPSWRKKQNAVLVEKTAVLQEGSALKPDIVVFDGQHLPVVVETSFSATDADRDAENRLGKTLSEPGIPIHTTVAVHLDDSFRQLRTSNRVCEVLIGGHPIRYALHQRIEQSDGCNIRRWPSAGFISGTVHDLVAFLSIEAVPQEIVDEVAQRVARKVQQAANRVETKLSSRWFAELTSMVNQRTHLGALHTTMVLWLNALLVQYRLNALADSASGIVRLRDAGHIDPHRLIADWRLILDTNWHAVFALAVKILEKFVNRDLQATSWSLEFLIDAVNEIGISRVGLHLNIGAELFPRLADDRKESAAFYTQPSTAELLAHLTVGSKDIPTDEWICGELLRNRSIADLACGTGTLLRAGYRRVMDLHERFGATEDSLGELHRGAMEQGLIGTDISPIAAHLTTSSLASLCLLEKYSTTQIGWLEVGGSSGFTGSLEYLQTNQARDLFEKLGGMTDETWEESNGSTVVCSDNSVDWILMNPPYSRTRGGQSAFDVAGLDDEMRQACQARWKRLVRKEPVDNRAGMAASFLAMARKKVKPGGRIGFVLPLTAAFASSWALTRGMLAREFCEITAIAVAGGRALGRSALSADTHMEEMLLVATKRARIASEPSKVQVCCVTLVHPLVRVGQSTEIGRAIAGAKERISESGRWYPIHVGNDEVGSMTVIELVNQNDTWSSLGVVSPPLANAASLLVHGSIEYEDVVASIDLPMTTIGHLFEVGPTHDLIGHLRNKDPRGAFEFHELRDDDDVRGPDRSLWHADSKSQRQLLVRPTHKGIPPPNEDRGLQQASMRKSRSTLLYSRNMRWTSQALLAATTYRPVMGGSTWTTLVHHHSALRSAFSLWANSTLGMLLHWTQGQRTHAGRSRTQINALREIPCPDLASLPEKDLLKADRFYQDLCREPLLPACMAHCDPVRKRIDQCVTDLLQLPSTVLDPISELRQLWCREPSVHGNNKQALKMLDKNKS